MTKRAAAIRPAEPARVAETVPSSTVSASRDAGASGGRATFAAPSTDARVSTLLAPRVQMETRVSSPSDPAEREAVATARKVMRMAAPPAPPSTPGASAPARAALNASPLLRAPAIHRSASAAPPSTIHRAPAPAAAPKPRAAARVPRADDVMPEIRSEMGGGTPLPPSVRGFLEPRFRAGFGAVRIHTNEKAAGLAARLAARAFTIGKHIFFGKGEYRPSDPAGMELIAHELTHTIQQKEVVQRQEDVTVSERSEPAVQRLGFDDILDWIADKANAIPGFRMFTIVLGVNPVNMSPVDRSAANILRAVVEFIPGGNLITRALDTYGIFEKVGGWIEGQIRGLGMVGSAFKSALSQFISSLGLRDLVRPGNVWDRAKRIFTEPIDRLKNFAAGFIGGILDFLREAVLRPIARLAEGTPAYGLLKAVLGKDPVTGEPVDQSADALIGGFMTLIGQQEVYENVKKGNAVGRALAWFKGTLAGVLGFVRAVPGLIVSTFRSITLDDVLPITNLFAKVGRAFGGFVGSFLSWGLGQVLGLLQIVIEVVAPSVMPYLRRAAGAFQQIVRNPAGFVGNLVRAGVLGFRQFGRNFLSHLRASLIGWLTGTMAGANIYIPQALNLREVIKFVLSVLGLTWQNIRGKLVRVVGETAVVAMEAGFAIVRTLVTQGPAAAWEQIREGIGNLQEMVMGQVMTFVRNRVVQAAIATLASSLIPGAGFIRAIIAIYDTVTFFVQRLRQIGAVVAAYIDSIAAIAAGNIGSAANRVETTMAGMLTLVVSFLAQIARLGNVSAAVLGIINRVRAPIDRALDRVVAWIVAQVRRLGSMVGGRDARSPAEKQRDVERAARELRPRVRELFRRGPPGRLFALRIAVWRTQYRLTSLSVQPSGAIVAAINPTSIVDNLVPTPNQVALAIIQAEITAFFAGGRASPSANTVRGTGAGTRADPFRPAEVGSVAQGIRAVLSAPGGAPRETSWVMGTFQGRDVIAILQRTATPTPGQGEVFMFNPVTGRRVRLGAYARSREVPGISAAPAPTGANAATRVAGAFGGSGSMAAGFSEEMAVEGRIPGARTREEAHAAAAVGLLENLEGVRNPLGAVVIPSAMQRTARSGVAAGTTLSQTMGGSQAAVGSADDWRLARFAISRFDPVTGAAGTATAPQPGAVSASASPGSQQRAGAQMLMSLEALSNTILEGMLTNGLLLILGPADMVRIRERTREFLRQRYGPQR